jgi:uncharacterized protein
LGILYAVGDNVPEDLSKAGKWFQKAAEQGDSDLHFNARELRYISQAQYTLGRLYESGLGVPQERIAPLAPTRGAYWKTESVNCVAGRV